MGFRLSGMWVVTLALLTTGIGCAPNQNADQLREKTAEATATMRSDAKAVAEGVKEGWNRDKPLDLNKASKDQLLSLPGVSSHQVDRIVTERPFGKTQELVSRHILSQEEYDKIKDRVIASQ